jgi:uroporphyrinogen III methyltransferase/synthase
VTVYLVGAGPGDPGLLTVRGAELLGAADVVIHDRLIDRRILALVSETAEVIDVGKRASDHPVPQASINALLVERGRSRSVVVRLKGGDPYIFGRGGEEAEALAHAGVPYEVVPGVSSVSAAAAAAGVPITMRGHASAFTVVTGHDVIDASSTVDWESVARSNATIVVLMGSAVRAGVAERLIAAGRSPETPVLAVEAATMPKQRSVRMTLGELGRAEIGTPATIVVGSVARLALASYEDRPLAGRRIVVTRAAAPRTPFEQMLNDAGAEVRAFPTIAITDPADGGAALEKAAGAASGYDWIIFSSETAVDRFFAALRDVRSIGSARVAAIGSATAASLRTHGIVADLVPLRYVDEALLEAFVAPNGEGRVLLPRAAVARDVLPDGLRALGWHVDIVETYRTVHPAPDPAALDALTGADAVTFLSSSAVHGFLMLAGADRLPPVVASIGPVTSATLREAGIDVTVEAIEHTAAGLVAALSEFPFP